MPHSNDVGNFAAKIYQRIGKVVNTMSHILHIVTK